VAGGSKTRLNSRLRKDFHGFFDTAYGIQLGASMVLFRIFSAEYFSVNVLTDEVNNQQIQIRPYISAEFIGCN
jgi:hypothetical protein